MIEFLLLAIALLALMGAIYYAFFRRSEKASPAQQQPAPEPDPVQDLLGLNLEVRKAAIPDRQTALCEDVIDKLIDLIPKIETAGDPSGELAWTVNRIASEYLPNKCVRPYIALSPEHRNEPEQIELFEQSLATLSQELDEVTEIISRRDRNEFASKAKFLKHRFTNTGDA